MYMLYIASLESDCVFGRQTLRKVMCMKLSCGKMTRGEISERFDTGNRCTEVNVSSLSISLWKLLFERAFGASRVTSPFCLSLWYNSLSLSFTTNDQKVRQISDARIRRGLCQSRQEEETKDFERLKVFVMSRHDSRRRDKNLKPRNPVSVDPQRRLHTQDVQLDRSSKLTLEGLCDGNNHVSSVLNPEMDVQWSSCSSFRASMKDLSSTSFLDD